QSLVGMTLTDGAEHSARDAGRLVDIHPHLDQALHDVLDLRFGRAFFHYNNHGFRRLQCLHYSRAAWFGLAGVSACTTRRSRVRASSMMRSNSRPMASGPSGPSHATSRTWRSTSFSRSG